jgi:lipopolysaccharide export system protein LptA
MKKLTFLRVILMVVLALPAGAWAEKADRHKPMQIDADTLRFDNLKQVSVYSGGVMVSKGTIRLRGAQLEVRQDPEGFQFALVTGSAASLAFFRQKREGVDEFIEGEGEIIEYDGRTDTVKFTNKAQLRRLRGSVLADEITGGLIVYDNLSETFSVDGNSSKSVGTEPATGRVRVVLTPKPQDDTSVTAAPVTLKPASALKGSAK